MYLRHSEPDLVRSQHGASGIQTAEMRGLYMKGAVVRMPIPVIQANTSATSKRQLVNLSLSLDQLPKRLSIGNHAVLQHHPGFATPPHRSLRPPGRQRPSCRRRRQPAHRSRTPILRRRRHGTPDSLLNDEPYLRRRRLGHNTMSGLTGEEAAIYNYTGTGLSDYTRQ